MNTLPWALPCEYEALLFSKKVSESLLGKNVVLDYAEEQKAKAQRKKEWKELEKWRFFLEELDVQESFDLHRQTDSIVDLNREALQAKFPNNNGDGPDYTKTNWRE
jgi:ribosomal protein L14E/L6E/L27E